MPASAIIAIVSVAITFSIFLFGVVFKMGHLSARVESLEKWRENLRADMHEISDRMSEMTEEIRTVKTLIEERTERRTLIRKAD